MPSTATKRRTEWKTSRLQPCIYNECCRRQLYLASKTPCNAYSNTRGPDRRRAEGRAALLLCPVYVLGRTATVAANTFFFFRVLVLLNQYVSEEKLFLLPSKRTQGIRLQTFWTPDSIPGRLFLSLLGVIHEWDNPGRLAVVCTIRL